LYGLSAINMGGAVAEQLTFPSVRWAGGGVMRPANRSYSVRFDGGPVEAAVAGLNIFEPITRAHYLAFGLRYASLTNALDELAEIPERKVPPKIPATFETALGEFGFERR
jgi:hypothetical protein